MQAFILAAIAAATLATARAETLPNPEDCDPPPMLLGRGDGPYGGGATTPDHGFAVTPNVSVSTPNGTSTTSNPGSSSNPNGPSNPGTPSRL